MFVLTAWRGLTVFREPPPQRAGGFGIHFTALGLQRHSIDVPGRLLGDHAVRYVRPPTSSRSTAFRSPSMTSRTRVPSLSTMTLGAPG